jgi:5-(carboxyamino)imidazole ribonucleotide mutase
LKSIIVSAHRTPEIFDFSNNAHTRGISVVIAGAGGAAHLPNGRFNVATSHWRAHKSSNSIDGWIYLFFKCQESSNSCTDSRKKIYEFLLPIIGSHDKNVMEKIIIQNRTEKKPSTSLEKLTEIEKLLDGAFSFIQILKQLFSINYNFTSSNSDAMISSLLSSNIQKSYTHNWHYP